MESMEIDLKEKTVLVTGGAGFIGSHLVDRLVEEGAQVVVVDNLFSGKKENIRKEALFEELDIRDEKLPEVFAKHKPVIVFHLAAQPLVETAYKNPAETLDVNIMGTVRVLESCRQIQDRGLHAVIVASSDKAYGKLDKLPYTEEDFQIDYDHPYDFSKSVTDSLARLYYRVYALPVVSTRFGNTYGPRDYNFGRIIPDCFEAILKNKELQIRSDGKAIREYVYAKDAANGFLKIAEHMNAVKGQMVNFGSGAILSVLDVVQEIEKILDVKIPYKILNIAKNEIPEQHLDWTKAKTVLGWQPEYPFEHGIKESFEWYKQHFKT